MRSISRLGSGRGLHSIQNLLALNFQALLTHLLTMGISEILVAQPSPTVSNSCLSASVPYRTCRGDGAEQ